MSEILALANHQYPLCTQWCSFQATDWQISELASVMVGQNDGVFGILRRDIPSINCIAHNLEVE